MRTGSPARMADCHPGAPNGPAPYPTHPPGTLGARRGRFCVPRPLDSLAAPLAAVTYEREQRASPEGASGV